MSSKRNNSPNGTYIVDECKISFLIQPYHRQDQAPAHLIIYWKFLFQCIGPTIRQSLKLRAYCRLFRDALPPPPVSYLSFPHSQYATLKLLTTHLSTLYKTNPLSIPKHVLISSGTHIVEEHHETICGSNVNLLTIDFPITFLGDSTTETVIEGGFLIKMPETNGDPTSVASVTTTPQTTIKNVTLRRSKWSGIWNHFSSGQVHLENVVVDDCEFHGIDSIGGITKCKNVEVKNCKGSGIFCHSGISSTTNALSYANSTVEIGGANMSIHHNCTNDMNRSFGLSIDTGCEFLNLELLNLADVCTNNGGGGDIKGVTPSPSDLSQQVDLRNLLTQFNIQVPAETE